MTSGVTLFHMDPITTVVFIVNGRGLGVQVCGHLPIASCMTNFAPGVFVNICFLLSHIKCNKILNLVFLFTVGQPH